MTYSRTLAMLCIAMTATLAGAEGTAEGLKRLDFLVGEWRGTSRGEPGEGTIERSCERVLNGRFIECRTTVTYKNEVHVERSFYGYDKREKKLTLRQFHGEGFVNTYIETEPLLFVTDSIENIPPGWRARETYNQKEAGGWTERFELAAPGKDFASYSESTLDRVK